MSTGTRRARPKEALGLIRGTVDQWLAGFGSGCEIGRLLHRPAAEQQAQGYEHTLREIAQQPVTWLETGAAMAGERDRLRTVLEKAGVLSRQGAILLTGSGSSLYVGECLGAPLQVALHVPVQAVPAGLLLTHHEASLPPSGPYLVVSFARSGNSPESLAVLDSLLEDDDRGRHLVITCNRTGALATAATKNPRVDAVVLDEKTEDKSLVMTSSFTNMVLAGAFLGETDRADAYEDRVESIAGAAATVLHEYGDAVAEVAAAGFASAVYLGSGCRLGSAHEAGLKALEMTGGRVSTLTESFLGLRHGPMSAVHDDTLVVAFLSSDDVVRAYETDLLGELDRKELGARKLIVGSDVPRALASRPGDVIVECGDGLGDGDLAVLDVLVGQLLGFFRCRHEGLHPDSPSDGVINRVVESFTIHRRR
jgi:fructoselysine-6-P-deglycase FrlB-like protein